MENTLVLVTSTYYDKSAASNGRVPLFIETLNKFNALVEQGLNVKLVICDGGSTNEDFLAMYRDITSENIMKLDTSDKTLYGSMGDERRFGFKKALELGDRVMYLDAEKSALLTESNVKRVGAELDNGSDVVVIGRKPEVFETMPKWQAYYENLGNKTLMQMAGDSITQVFDLWFGPKAFNRKGAEEFLKNTGKRWSCIINPVISAIKSGLKITQVEVNFEYAENEITNEVTQSRLFSMKRFFQFIQIMAEAGHEAYVNSPIANANWKKIEAAISKGDLKGLEPNTIEYDLVHNPGPYMAGECDKNIPEVQPIIEIVGEIDPNGSPVYSIDGNFEMRSTFPNTPNVVIYDTLQESAI